jgi:hypothetical protein
MRHNRILKMWPEISVFRIGPGRFPLKLTFWLYPLRFNACKLPVLAMCGNLPNPKPAKKCGSG